MSDITKCTGDNHKEWWSNLLEHEKEEVKLKFHEHFKFGLIKKLSLGEIRTAYVLIKREEMQVSF